MLSSKSNYLQIYAFFRRKTFKNHSFLTKMNEDLASLYDKTTGNLINKGIPVVFPIFNFVQKMNETLFKNYLYTILANLNDNN